MKWSQRQILETLRFIEESEYDEVRLETDGFRLHVRKSGAPSQLDASSSASVGTAGPDARPGTATDEVHASAGAGANRPVAAEPLVPEGMTAIRAPMVGTFYRAPAPHLPPFVEVGATVKADDTVCLVEVMKLFNTIKAGVGGRVVQIVAQNAATVQKDEVLMIIGPFR